MTVEEIFQRDVKLRKERMSLAVAMDGGPGEVEREYPNGGRKLGSYATDDPETHAKMANDAFESKAPKEAGS